MSAMSTNYNHAHDHLRPRLFRSFVTQCYWANRDEYDSLQQEHPYTFEQYVSTNLQDLKRGFKLRKRELEQAARVVKWRTEWKVSQAV